MVKRSTLIWGSILTLIGVLLLLDSLAIIHVDAWGLFWALLLVALGVWILWGVTAGPRTLEAEQASIPLEGAGQARVRVCYGAGRLRVDASASPDELVTGTFGGGLDRRARRDGDKLDVEMRVPRGIQPGFVFPWLWGTWRTLDWSFGLNGEVPLSLDFEVGACDARLDLTDLRVADLRLQTGASATELTLPANAGHTRVKIGSGAAYVKIRVPSGVAARIRISGALTGITVDKSRFPREGGVYQSLDYDAAANKVDIAVDTGVGSVEIR